MTEPLTVPEFCNLLKRRRQVKARVLVMPGISAVHTFAWDGEMIHQSSEVDVDAYGPQQYTPASFAQSPYGAALLLGYMFQEGGEKGA